MERRAQDDEEMNAYGRPPIGEGKQEQVSWRSCLSMVPEWWIEFIGIIMKRLVLMTVIFPCDKPLGPMMAGPH